ncbi:MAG: hypothetical protein RMI01_08915, partial [Thermodesulfovibrio sp.]|nr:hypothetical protein [Thermodesulfovibrio sp.]
MDLSLLQSLSNVFSYKETEVPLISKKGAIVKVSSLLVKDELELVSSLSIAGYTREENFLKLLFRKIDPESRTKLWNDDFETFLKSVGEADVNSIAMGIIIATHENEFQFNWKCPHCETENSNIINPVNVASTTYPDCQDLFECSSKVVDVVSDNL